MLSKSAWKFVQGDVLSCVLVLVLGTSWPQQSGVGKRPDWQGIPTENVFCVLGPDTPPVAEEHAPS